MSQRKALVVGISVYLSPHDFVNLEGASIDANNIDEILRNRGGFFPIKRLTQDLSDKRDALSTSRSANQTRVDQEDLRNAIESFFKSDGNTIPDIALFYFSGHGYRDGQGNCYLCATNSTTTDIESMISLDWLGALINACTVKKQVIWLDCCFSGDLLNTINHEQEGINRFLVTACDRNEKAIENSTKGGDLTQKLLLKGLKVESHGENCQIVDSQLLEQWIKREIEKLPIEEQLLQQPQIYQDPNTKINLTVKEKMAGVDLEDHGKDPYKSLDFFAEEDARFFYGRDKKTQSLIEDLHKNKFVAVTGASGVGKSSLLRAGLLYQLKKQETSKNWDFIELIDLKAEGKKTRRQKTRRQEDKKTEDKKTEDRRQKTRRQEDKKTKPLSRLSTAINEFINFQTNPSGSQEVSILNQEVEKDPKKLVDKLASFSKSNPIVLVIDQFEECFHPNNNAEKDNFFGLLTELVQRDTLPLYLVIGMRSHSFENALKEEKYATFFKKSHPVKIDLLKGDRLEEAIKEPAKRVRLIIEDDLKQQISTDFKDNLALMEYILAELTKNHKTKYGESWNYNSITLKDYRIFQKDDNYNYLNSLAHQSYDALSVGDKQIAKYILLKLIKIDDDEPYPKPRPISLKQLECSHFPPDAIKDVSEKLADGRLITIDVDPNDSNKVKLELSHKDLITKWKDFKNLIEDYKDSIIYIYNLEKKADKKELLTGKELQEFDKLKKNQLNEDGLYLNHLTEKFILDSKQKVERDRIRQRKITLGFSIFAFILLAIIGYFIYENDQKDKQQKADKQKILDQTNGTSDLLQEFNTDTITDIEKSIDVGSNLKTYYDDFTAEKRSQIISSLYDTVIGRSDQRFRMSERLEFPDKINRVSVSPDNSYVALATKEKVILRKIVHDPSQKDNDELKLFQNDEVKSVSFSPDGTTIATGSNGQIILWQCENNKVKILICAFRNKKQYPKAELKKIVLPTQQEWVNSVSFSADGKMLASASFEKITIWKCKAPIEDLISNCTNNLDSHILGIESPKDRWFNDVSFAPSPYHNFLASADNKGCMQVWKLDNNIEKSKVLMKGDVERCDRDIENSFPVNKVSFAVQNKILKLAAASKEKINIWMMGDPSSKLVSCFELQHDKWAKKGGAYINSVNFSSDGKRLISGGQDKIVKIWNTDINENKDSDNCLQNGAKKNLPKSDQPNALMQTLLLEGDAKDINFYGDSDSYKFVSASYKDRGIVKLWQEIKIGEPIGLDKSDFWMKYIKKNLYPELRLVIKSFTYDVSNIFLSSDGQTIAAIQDFPKNAISIWKTKDQDSYQSVPDPITQTKFLNIINSPSKSVILSELDPYNQSIEVYDELNFSNLKMSLKKDKLNDGKDNDVSDKKNKRRILPDLMLPSPERIFVLSPDGNFLATLSEYENKNSCPSNSQKINIWSLKSEFDDVSDPSNKNGICKESSKDLKYRNFGFSRDNNFFAFLEVDKQQVDKKTTLRIEKKDMKSDKFTYVDNLPKSINDPKAFAFNPYDDNKLAVLSLKDKALKISIIDLRNVSSEELPIKSISCDDDSSIIQYPTNNNKRLAVACRDIVYLFDSSNGKIMNILPHSAKVAKFSFNDKRLISLDTDKKLYYWNFEKNDSDQFYLKLKTFACKRLLKEEKCNDQNP